MVIATRYSCLGMGKKNHEGNKKRALLGNEASGKTSFTGRVGDLANTVGGGKKKLIAKN